MKRFLMKKVIKIMVLVAVSIMLFTGIARAVIEDFDTWTEVDAGSDITVSGNNTSWIGARHEHIGYVYKDLGSNQTESLRATFMFSMDTGTDDAGLIAHFGVSSGIGGMTELEDAGETGFWFSTRKVANPTPYQRGSVKEYADGSSSMSVETGISLDGEYYATVLFDRNVSDNGTVYYWIYTDSARTDLQGSGSVVMSKELEYRYIYAMATNNNPVYGAGNYDHDGQTEGMEISYLPDAPTITTDNVSDIVFNDFFADYDATFNATLDDDGGEECTIAWYYTVKDAEEWNLVYNASESFTTGQSANFTVIGEFELDVAYEYFTRAYNSEYSSDGATLEFIPVESVGIPTILTWNYPISLDTDNLTARLYGRVQNDGSSNVTAYFYYREYSVGDWLLSDNITDLQSATDYNILVTANLTLGKSYQFQAGGINDTGEGVGGIGSFTMAELTMPVVATMPATFIEDNQARVSGNVTDLGGDTGGLESWFQWRLVGEHTWQDTPIIFMIELGTYSRLLQGLNEYENYEYRAVVHASILGVETDYTAYGDILTFNTMATVQNPVMVTGNATYLSEGFVGLNSFVYYDGGSSVTVWSQYRPENTVTWTDTESSSGAVTNDTVTQFATGLVNETIYDYRSAGTNSYGTSYGSIRQFYLTTDTIIPPDGDIPPETGNVFLDFINEWRVSMGLIGTFGTWAFMGMIILAVSLLFGIAMVVVDTAVGRSAVGVAWLLSSISVIGAFLFTGQLGIWPILILTGGLVALIVIVLSVKLSGGGNNG